jgi:hypothetical protein
MNSPRTPSPLRFGIAALGWVAAMVILLIGGIVGGNGKTLLTGLAIGLLALSLVYIFLQIVYLNRAQKGSGPRTADREPGPRRPR